MNCILAHNQTTPEKNLSNPFFGKGFCEPNQYKSAVERCEGGYRSCELGIDISKDLVKILENAAEAIRQWSIRSQKHISQSKEFNTTRKAWIGTIQACAKLAERNDHIAKSVQQNVVEKMVAYKEKNYGKSFLHVKSIKQFEKDFKKTQKSWLELLDKITEAKEAYHTAREKFNGAEKSAKVTQSDVGSTDEEKKKAQTSVAHYKSSCESHRTKYQKVFQEMEKAKPDYERDMIAILERTHTYERERMAHFQETFTALKVATSLEKDECHPAMLQAFKESIELHVIEDDIKFFDLHYGRETKTKWPTFEESAK